MIKIYIPTFGTVHVSLRLITFHYVVKGSVLIVASIALIYAKPLDNVFIEMSKAELILF